MNEPLSSEAIHKVADLLVKIGEMETAIDQAIEAMEFTWHLYELKESSTLVKSYRELKRVRKL